MILYQKAHVLRFSMHVYASRNIHSLYLITFLDSLFEVPQDFPTLNQIITLEIELKCIISDYKRTIYYRSCVPGVP